MSAVLESTILEDLVQREAANAVFGPPRMRAIFGGMHLSGKRAAELAMDILSAGQAASGGG